MVSYTLRRIAIVIPTLLGISLLTFAILQVTPGNPVRIALGIGATPQRIAEVRRSLGLDNPILLQYWHYVWGLFHGNLGVAIDGQVPVRQQIFQRLPSTLQLAGAGLLLAVVFGVGIGAIAGSTKRRALDSGLMVASLSGLSLPVFWVGIIGIYIFAVRLNWVSAFGGTGLRNLILPAVVVALAPGATLAQITRASVLEVIGEDHVRTAMAKGLSPWRVSVMHIVRNALIPVVTVLGLVMSDLITGAVFVEVIFSRPGLGSYAVTAVEQRDFPQVQGVVLFVAVVYVLVNLATDLLYGALDPRVRVGARLSR